MTSRKQKEVYAGGAIITEQKRISATSAEVTWLSADPVTGSYSSISKNGTSYGDARKEYEPLGQEVLTEAPPDEIDTAQPETSAVRSASEPEWLCGLSRINDLSFWEKPVQCQIASLESDNFFLGNLFSKGNAAHVSTAPPRGAASGQSGGLPVNLTPTNKPSSTASAATSLAITNTPSADGCNYDAQGNPNCAVQSQRAVDIPIKFTAEYSGDKNNVASNLLDLPNFEALGKNSRFILYKNGEEDTVRKIKDIITYATKNNSACAEAFKAVGATPIEEQLSSISIVTEDVLKDKTADGWWERNGGEGDNVRQGLVDNPTTNDLSGIGPNSASGRRFLGVANRAIREDDDFLSVVIIHSFIHTGGIAGQKMSHDLKFLGEKYKTILAKCTREGHSNALYNQ